MPSLFACYIVFGNLKATDPLDHIYALLGLSDVKSLGIMVDYTANPQELLRNVVRAHIRRYHNLDFLELVSICALDAEREWATSWTPNIYRPLRVFPLAQSVEVEDGSGRASPTYAAGLNDQEELSWACIEDLSDRKKLVLPGILLDTVQEVTSTSSAVRLSFDDTRKMFQKTLPSNATTTDSRGQILFDAYWRTLMFDATALQRIQDQEVERFRNAFQGILDGNLELSPVQDSQAFWSSMQQILVCFAAGTIPCSFGYTQKAFMARFPQGTNEGDIIAVLYGGRTPFILRPILGNDDEYLLVGPAYVHGFMDGEAFKFHDAGLLEARGFILV